MSRVAIVDDDSAHSRALARLLHASGIETEIFASAEAFLARSAPEVLDALILDLQLGGMTGFELQRRLALAGPAPPVVFLTAHAEPETIARAAAAGCPFVRKTDPAAVLLDALGRAMAPRGSFPKGK
jgi:FixJ family two-component response regulator